ncbi:sugar ABC transporter ATP-binding protein [Burkholderia stagnalis]
MADNAPDRSSPILEVAGIRKQFGSVVALDHVSFDVRAGEVHALVGENGAGKSTLLSIMNGLQRPNEGDMRLDGAPLAIDSPLAARRQGIALVHQEIALCPNMTVAENIFLGNEPRSRTGNIDTTAMDARARELLDAMRVPIEPGAMVSSLSLSQQQLVEICKALATRPRLLILDEPTASLTSEHVDTLLETCERLRATGLGIVYVSHRLEEVLRIADRITVLRDGRSVVHFGERGASIEAIVRAMVGRDLGEHFPERDAPPQGRLLLEVDRLGARGRFDDVSLQVRAGEIVGIAGLLGCEREAVIRALFGLQRVDTGEIRIDGVACRLTTPRRAVRRGLAYLPADRKAEGLVPAMSVHDNLALTTLRRLTQFGLISRRRRDAMSRAMIGRLDIKACDPSRGVVNLSGGNQQKVVLGKWLARDARVFVVEEPTRGVDVGGKPQIWQALQSVTTDGKGVLLVSSELPELMALCDRIVVMSRGRVTGSFTRAEFDAEVIAHCALSAVAAC